MSRAQLARSRALRQLAGRHPDEFDALYRHERTLAGLHAEPGATRRKPIDADHLADAYRSGVPVAELAARHRVSEETVRRRLRDAGVALAPNGKRKEERGS